MKNLLLFPVLILFTCTNLFAQATVERSFKVSKDQTLDLNLNFAKDININTWSKNEVQIIATVKMGDKNTREGYDISVSKKRDKHIVESSLDYSKVPTITMDADKIDDVNFEGPIALIGYKDGHWQALAYELSYEIKMPEYLALNICTSKGNVEVKGVDAGLDIKTNGGFIDVARKASDKANVELVTTSGEIFTDFDGIAYEDIPETDKSSHACSSNKIKATINGGGENDIVLSSNCGNIYLRKL